MKFGYSLVPVLLAGLAMPALGQDDGPSAPNAAKPFISQPEGAPARDWLTWGYDAERTGWNRGETGLTPANVSGLKLLWDAKVGTVPQDVSVATLTSPVVMENVATPQGHKTVLFTIGADSSFFAIDADSGKILWQKKYPDAIPPMRKANSNCPNTEQATPTIDKARGIVFFTTSDGKLHGLAVGTGAEKMKPQDMVAPYSRNWSLNFVNNVVYTAAGRGCGNGEPFEAGNVSAMDVSDLAHPQLSRFTTGHARPAGPWGRGGPVWGPKGVYVQTADGPYDPGAGIYGNAAVAVSPKAYGLADSFSPTNNAFLNMKDLDFGSGSPVIFPLGKRTLLATGGKEGYVYVLDANNLGGADHNKPFFKSPRYGNDEQTYAGHGIWGGLSSALNAAGERMIYVPLLGPLAKDAPKFQYTNGDITHGAVMAFRVLPQGDGITLDPLWTSPDLAVTDSVAVANGVVYAVQTGEQTIQHPDNPEGHGRAVAGGHMLTQDELSKFRSTGVAQFTLYALDAETGKPLYSSQNALPSFTHFTETVVAVDKVFLVSHEAHVYAFGLK